MLSEARYTTASKSVALDAFKVFLQVTGRASLDQLLLNREESCSLSLFTDYAEYLQYMLTSNRVTSRTINRKSSYSI